jgi:hypothetical protein
LLRPVYLLLPLTRTGHYFWKKAINFQLFVLSVYSAAYVIEGGMDNIRIVAVMFGIPVIIVFGRSQLVLYAIGRFIGKLIYTFSAVALIYPVPTRKQYSRLNYVFVRGF